MSMEKLKSFPRIAISQFPRSNVKSSDFGVRTALVRLFNYGRQHPHVMDNMRENLKMVLAKIEEWDEVRKQVETEIIASGGKIRGTGDSMLICDVHGKRHHHPQAQVAPLFLSEPPAFTPALPATEPMLLGTGLQPVLPASASPLATMPVQTQVLPSLPPLGNGLATPYVG